LITAKHKIIFRVFIPFIPVFQIEEIFQKEWARPVKNQSSGILTKHLRLATPEEIAFVTKPKLRFDYKFKIGDKVRIVKKRNGLLT